MAPRPVRQLITAYVFVSMLLQWIVTFIVQEICIILTYPFIDKYQRQDMCSAIFRWVSHFGTNMANPAWRLHVLNKFPETKHNRRIVMMNHLSNADPFVTLEALLPHDGSWVSKDVLFRVPFGGWAMHNGGDLCVKFKNKRAGFETVKGSVGPMMEEARQKVRRGRIINIFPEGTRNPSPEGPLQPFRLGFFKLAVEEGLIIVPLGISGTERLWPHGSMLLDCGDAYFSFGEPIDATQFKTAEELSDHVWKVLSDLRETHPDRIAYHAAQKKAE